LFGFEHFYLNPSRPYFHFKCQCHRRLFSADTKPAAVVATPKKSGAGFFQRVSSFLVGAGLTALVSQFYIYTELVEGNKIILQKQKALESRIAALEK
jgi:hypothetical protein